MVDLLLIIGVLLVAKSAHLAVRGFSVPRLELKRHLHDISDYGFEPASEEATAAPRGRLHGAFGALAERLGGFAAAHVTALPSLRRGQLAAAGIYQATPETIHGYRALAAIALAAVVGLFAVMTGGGSVLMLFAPVAAAAAGWQVPAIVINGKGKRRLAEIDKELPELIDLLIATVEAGMGFSASLGLVATRLRGALGDEVRLTIRKQNLGISTSEALDDMLERCDTQSMRSFVNTITRGESMGLSIAPILRELATDMRRRRRQAASEKMQKAPVKILFPMMFLIMPALMIVLFYPAAYSVMTGSSGV